MNIPSINFEAQLWSATHRVNRKEEVTVLTLHVHPTEAAQLMDMALQGKRFMVGMAEIADDEQPVEPPAEETVDVPWGPKQTWESMKPSQQAGMLCNGYRFWDFLSANYSEKWDHARKHRHTVDSAAVVVRLICKVASRADLDEKYPLAAKRWAELVREYHVWNG